MPNENEEENIPHANSAPITWRLFPDVTDYEHIIATMKEVGAALAEATTEIADEQIFVMESTPVYTNGTKKDDWALFNPHRHPIYEEDRGGSYSYYGPGMRLYAPILHLKRRGIHLGHYQHMLARWIIQSLKKLGIDVHNNEKWEGAWVRVDKEENTPTAAEVYAHMNRRTQTPQQIQQALEPFVREYKIGSIGIHVKRWISYYGIAINYAANPEDMAAMRLCSLPPYYGVASLKQLGYTLSAQQLDAAFRETAPGIFHTSLRVLS